MRCSLIKVSWLLHNVVSVIISSGEMIVHGWEKYIYTRVSGNVSEKIILEPSFEVLGEGKWKASVMWIQEKGQIPEIE